MKRNASTIRLVAFSILMVVVILDSATAVHSIISSISLCFKTVIPGMFPVLFLGSAISAELSGIRIPFLEKMLHIPKGTAGFVLMGTLCGYPAGAKLLQDAAQRNYIDKSNANRMICFCNNASPAFIIGIMTSVFSSLWSAVCMWVIQIISSVLLGSILAGEKTDNVANINGYRLNLSKIMSDTLKTMATICGWIMLCGMVLSYVNKSILNIQHPVTQILICGAIELTSGVLQLNHIQNDALQFILGGTLLSFGGLCVLLQTRSVAPDMNCKYYVKARLLHAGFSATLSSVVALLIFPDTGNMLHCIPLLLSATVVGCIILIFNKKRVAIATRM